MILPCPDCEKPRRTLLAPTLPPFSARRLCVVCGHPLGAKLTLAQLDATGYRLDIKDEFGLLLLHYPDDETIAA